MIVKAGFKEVLFLTIIFTSLAIYFDIYNEKHVLAFIINHVIALIFALAISKIIQTIILKYK